MLRAGPVRREGGSVLGCGVALVPREVVLRPLVVQLHHHPITGHLRDHRRGGHAGRDPVALPHRERRRRHAGDREPVRQHVRRAGVEPADGLAHGPDVHHVQTGAVDLLRGHDDHGPREGASYDLAVRRFPGPLGEQLGIGQTGDLATSTGWQHDRGDHERSGAGTAAGLVGAGDEREAVVLQHPLKRPQTVLGADDRSRSGDHATRSSSSDRHSG